MCLGFEAHSGHQLRVVVLALRPHASDVEAEHGLDGQQRSGDGVGGVVLGDRDSQVEGDLEVVRTGDQLVGVHLLAVRRVVERQPTVGDLGRLGDVLRPLGADEDRDVGPQRVRHDLQRLSQSAGALPGVRVLVELAVEGQVVVAPECPTEDLDVLPGAGQRTVRGPSVPALHHLGP